MEGNFIIKILVGIIVAAVLVPVIITQIVTADQSGWDAGSVAIWGILGIFVVLAVFLWLVKVAVGKRA